MNRCDKCGEKCSIEETLCIACRREVLLSRAVDFEAESKARYDADEPPNKKFHVLGMSDAIAEQVILMTEQRFEERGHHIWCNGDLRKPVKGCRWCDPKGDGKEGLWALYPYQTPEEMDNLAAKHFPNAIRRT